VGTEPKATSRVLVVDDNEANRALAVATLEGESYDIVLASSGAEAIAAFQANPPDCILLDIRMPGMTGIEACARIRELPGGADTPIVFLTAQRDVDTFDAASKVGGDDFLTKPFRPTELVLRVQAALRLKRLNAENREYYELARRQRDDLMRLTLQKERLSAFVVHDLKNPVANVDLLAQLLLRDKELPERLRATVGTVRHEVRSLMRLITNLLDISKSEEGKLTATRARLDLEALVTEVLESSAPSARDRHITLARALEVAELGADPDLLRRVLENLLDNALRHAPDDSVVRVSSVAREGATELRVTDAGDGVPEAMRERIFDPFVQLESTARVSRSGRGLGLAFCRLAIEAHGGRVWVEDACPGAAFCARIPHAE
jgi:two-component system sensor histidine kinase/response regulator